MHTRLQRRRVLQAGLALSAAPWLPTAQACETITPTLRITHPWTRATGHGANSAVLCMKFDEVNRTDRLVLVDTPIASGADMGGLAAGPKVDFLIPEGQESHLDESGTYVRLLGLNAPLEVGRSYPLRLGFEQGGVFNLMLSVDYTRFK